MRPPPCKLHAAIAQERTLFVTKNYRVVKSSTLLEVFNTMESCDQIAWQVLPRVIVHAHTRHGVRISHTENKPDRLNGVFSPRNLPDHSTSSLCMPGQTFGMTMDTYRIRRTDALQVPDVWSSSKLLAVCSRTCLCNTRLHVRHALLCDATSITAYARRRAGGRYIDCSTRGP